MVPRITGISMWCALLGMAGAGCIEHHISAPDVSLVLYQGEGHVVAQLAESPVRPYLRQRQLGLFAGGITLSEDALRSEIPRDQKDVAFVAGQHFTDFLISASTYGFLWSNTVRVYRDVK